MNEKEKYVGKGRAQGFVQFVIQRCQNDKGIASALRRADNPATEYQSWDVLAAFHVDLANPLHRLPFACIAAAIAKAKIEHNGKLGIGQAIACCYGDGNNSDQAKAKLRRLLACDSVEELCRILRPLFSLIESKCSQPLDFARLLEQLLRFHMQDQKIKSYWANDFYHRSVDESTTTLGGEQ